MAFDFQSFIDSLPEGINSFEALRSIGWKAFAISSLIPLALMGLILFIVGITLRSYRYKDWKYFMLGWVICMIIWAILMIIGLGPYYLNWQ